MPVLSSLSPNHLHRLWRRLRMHRSRFAPVDWQSLLSGLPASRHLGQHERDRLGRLATDFLNEKTITGAGGLTPDDADRLLIAANACVPILNLGLGWYRGWHQVIVYPDTFVADGEFTDADGIVHRGRRPLSGEAWFRGPIVLSLRDIHATLIGDSGNVVVHEFAHKLDMGNGAANGMPPLHRSMDRQVWTTTLSGTFDHYCRDLYRDPATTGNDLRDALPFDPYACESPGEFFAVISEEFFMDPIRLRERLPEVYRQFSLFYRQDPRR